MARAVIGAGLPLRPRVGRVRGAGRLRRRTSHGCRAPGTGTISLMTRRSPSSVGGSVRGPASQASSRAVPMSCCWTSRLTTSSKPWNAGRVFVRAAVRFPRSSLPTVVTGILEMSVASPHIGQHSDYRLAKERELRPRWKDQEAEKRRIQQDMLHKAGLRTETFTLPASCQEGGPRPRCERDGRCSRLPTGWNVPKRRG